MKNNILLMSTFIIACMCGCSETNTNTKLEQQGDNRTAMAKPVFEQTIFIGVPADKVWDALINPDVVKEYYLAPLAKIDLKVGGEMYYGSAEHKMIDGKIEALESGKKLVHSFAFGHRPDDSPSRVTYEIIEMDKMCALKLTHDGFTEDSATFVDVSGGWPVILSSLKTLLETNGKLPWPKQ